MYDSYQIVRDFESALCEYTGAPYAVTTTSCTMALLLACKDYIENVKVMYWPNGPELMIPRRTYVGVPQSIIHAGAKVRFSEEEWIGKYQLFPSPIWDSARYFTSNMYIAGQFQCVSFHSSKILGDTQGGAILHDNPEADAWLRKARFDGRTEGVTPKNDSIEMLGYHCYMSPDVAARLLLKLSVLPEYNEPLPNDNYPDLSIMEIFK